MRTAKLLGCLALILTVASPLSADMKVKNRMTVSGHAMENTVMVKGARQRTEMTMAPGYTTVTLYQCDLNRMVQINDQAKTYLITDLSDTPPAPETPARPARPNRSAGPSRAGGDVTFTVHTTETGQKKVMFGYPARNIKSEMSTEASADSCSGSRDMKMSTDGWYIDMPGYAMSCASPERSSLRMRPEKPGCQDRTHFKTTGGVKLGFPVSVETTMMADGRPVTMKQEVIELKTTPLDAALFDIPAGYQQVSDQSQLMGRPDMAAMMRQAQSGESDSSGMSSDQAAAAEAAMNAARGSRPARGGQQAMTPATQQTPQSGVGCIGLVKFGGANLPPASASAMRDMLRQAFKWKNVSAVLLEVSATAKRGEVDAAAIVNNCGYVLYNDVTPPGATAPGSIGGLASGSPASTDNSKGDTTITYKLFKVAVGLPLLQTTIRTVEINDSLDGESQKVIEKINSPK